jgi:hypothetical protein
MRRQMIPIVMLGLAILVATGCGDGATVPVPAQSEVGPTVTTPRATAGMVLLDISGSDSKQSQVFTAPRDWDIQWEVTGAPSVGAGISAIIYESTGNFVAQPVVVQLDPGTKKSDVYHVHRAGSFYLDISGLGGWHFKVVTV